MENKTYVSSLAGSKMFEVVDKLPDALRREISQALGLSLADPSLIKFLNRLDSEIGIYRAFELQRQELAGLKQRISLLTRLSASLQKSLSELDKLDDLSYRILDQTLANAKGLNPEILPARQETGMADIRSFHPLAALNDELNGITVLADHLRSELGKSVKRGAPAKRFRQDLIDRIVGGYRDCFGKLPSSTRHGAFEEALALSLQSIKVILEDLHSEIIASLKRIRGK